MKVLALGSVRWQSVWARLVSLAFGIGLVLACESDSHAQSFGPSHLPSRFSQYLGWGYGAGHHAPIVKTPGVQPDRVPRWTLRSRCNEPLYSAAYGPLGCSGEACYSEAYYLPTPIASPAAVSASAPVHAVQPIPAVSPADRRFVSP